MKSNKIIYLIERDNWQKDDLFYKTLLTFLNGKPYTIVWGDPSRGLLRGVRILENSLNHVPGSVVKFITRLFKLLYGLFHWSYFSYLIQRKQSFIDYRISRLSRFIRKLSCCSEVIVLSRSAGGRYSSLIADELNIKHLICISYPFKHPEKEDEPERYQHLAKLQTPMLIIQGTHDEYGGLEIQEKYPLSPNIDLVFVEGDHDFRISDEDWQKVFGKLSEVLDA